MEARTRIAAIIIQNGKLLMLKGKGHDELWTPGGTLEAGESDEVCLMRELEEEIGVKLSNCKFFKEYKYPAFYRPEQELTERMYISEIEGGLKSNNEIEGAIWVSKGDLENKKFPMIKHDSEKLIPDIIEEGVW